MKPKFLIIFLAFCLFAPACAKHESAPTNPLKIAINVWPGYAYAYLAQEKGFFKKNNVNVELILKDSTPESLQLFKDGLTDGAFDTLTDVVLLNAQRYSAKVVLVVDYSVTGDVIIARPEIKTLAGLKNKTVSFEGVNTFSHLFVLKTLEKAGLSEIDLRFADVNAHDVLKALDEGKIDAGHTWEPTKSRALKKGYKILAKAGDMPGIITDVLVFSEETIEKRPGDIKAVIKSLLEAKEYMLTNPEESVKIMARNTGMSEAEMKSGLDGIHLIGLGENYEILTIKKSNSKTSLRDEGENIINFYLDRGFLSVIPDMNEMIDNKFVKELKNK